jgi:hypothetical protein
MHVPDHQADPSEHQQFDSLCAQVEDYEPLPDPVPVAGAPVCRPLVDDPDEQLASLDEVILAGLVSP